jgi:mono/diheme cytochrome c family protein
MKKSIAGRASRIVARGSIVATFIIPILALLALAVPALAETAVERGAYLVNTVMACGNCHTPRDASGAFVTDKAFSGGLTINTPAFVATAPNITQDRETGIGDWSDAEIKRALIEGVRPNHGHFQGVTLAAVMPASFYKALLPDDLDAIVAYLRTVKAVSNTVSDPEYKMPVHRQPYPDAEKGFAKSDFSDPVKHGAYLVTIGHCMECHSTFSAGVSDFKDGLGHGGREFGSAVVKGLPDVTVPNITADPVAGIGAWSDAEIARAIRQGVARDGHRLKPPMAYQFYAGLSDADTADIIAYLRTLK